MTDESPKTKIGSNLLWRFIKLICLGVALLSVLACVAMAAVRSDGLTQVTVTALDAEAEPRDHNIPFIKQKDALPDYTITVNSTRRKQTYLGVKPNESAIAGLVWKLPDPISTHDVASICLKDNDTVVSDVIAEVQFNNESVTSGNYRFEFATERSFGVGVESFFRTPVGQAITFAFTIAVLLMIFSLFAL